MWHKRLLTVNASATHARTHAHKIVDSDSDIHTWHISIILISLSVFKENTKTKTKYIRILRKAPHVEFLLDHSVRLTLVATFFKHHPLSLLYLAIAFLPLIWRTHRERERGDLLREPERYGLSRCYMFIWLCRLRLRVKLRIRSGGFLLVLVYVHVFSGLAARDLDDLLVPFVVCFVFFFFVTSLFLVQVRSFWLDLIYSSFYFSMLFVLTGERLRFLLMTCLVCWEELSGRVKENIRSSLIVWEEYDGLCSRQCKMTVWNGLSVSGRVFFFWMA